MTAPQNNDGNKQSANLRNGAPDSVSPRSEEGRATSTRPSPAAGIAAAIQMPSQCSRRLCVDERAVARSPNPPIAMPADPGTAIEAAESIEARIYRSVAAA